MKNEFFSNEQSSFCRLVPGGPKFAGCRKGMVIRMKEMWNTAKYRLQCYFRGYTFAMPFIVVCAILGAFFHPDICKDRKVAIALTVLLALLAILRDIIAVSQPVLKYVLWIVPNVAYVATQYGNEQFFNISISLQYFCILMIYAVIYGVVGSFWQCRKRA